ncbi:hypothetical protein NXC12_PD00461 (plasmid) [Rhizobium etli]|uniref:Uncharacterized protein n=1 Tax=Rhizobium etli TaxID=29449 RepID=A0AAN1BLS3_RHIET|nr:hypothetical protein NXC12_PD00461 [Rhizobium etli]
MALDYLEKLIFWITPIHDVDCSLCRPVSVHVRIGLSSRSPGPSEGLRAGIGPLRRSPHMSHDLSLTQSHVFQLSRDLMVPVTLFTVDSDYDALPSDHDL